MIVEHAYPLTASYLPACESDNTIRAWVSSTHLITKFLQLKKKGIYEYLINFKNLVSQKWHLYHK